MERAALLPNLFCRPRHWLYAVVAEPQREGELKSREGFLIVVLFWTVLGASVRSLLSSRKARTSRLPMLF